MSTVERYATATLKNESLRILRIWAASSPPPAAPVSVQAYCRNEMDTFLLQCTTRNVNANSVASAKAAGELLESGSRAGSESGESTLQVGDQIVAVFESDREPQKVGRDARFSLCF